MLRAAQVSEEDYAKVLLFDTMKEELGFYRESQTSQSRELLEKILSLQDELQHLKQKVVKCPQCSLLG